MLTLDAVRTALLSDQPWLRLDELVRAELASGQTTRQIYKSLMGLADEIDTTPDLSEDGSDAFGDILDALTGYCRADQCYKDPPNTTLPSEEEIAELPRWARVAFAARCARRVLPLFEHFWNDAPRRAIESLKWALDVPEGIAATGTGLDYEAGGAAGEAAVLDRMATPYGTACYTAAAISFAGDAAVIELNSEQSLDVGQAARSAVDAAQPIQNVTPPIRRDFDHIARLAEWQKWDDDTPVPPEVFGPLWPEGLPKGWPPVTDAPQRTELVIEAFARERATEEMIEDDIVNLFNALNRYHIVRSGVRLTLEQFQSLLPAFVPAEV